MITLDTSVIVSIVLKEDGWEKLDRVLLDNETIVSSVSIVEAYLVLKGRLKTGASEAILEVIDILNIRVVEFGLEQVKHAQVAFERFGKGNHPAKLNFGDCIVYATAKFTSTPLLFLGDDFSQTDIEAVKWN
jgi:ribonuclease VapC